MMKYLPLLGAVLVFGCSTTETTHYPGPMTFGEAKPLSPEVVSSIQNELAERVKLDQEVRSDPAGLEDDEAAVERMLVVDRDNTKWLKLIVKERGWIDVERFGAEAAGAAFLLVQHSQDLPLMKAALPLIEKDVRAGRLEPQAYALLYDRVQVSQGKKQRYGSQVVQDEDGAYVLAPLEDPERVEERRAEIGLIPLSQYLEIMEQATGSKVTTE